MKRLRTGAIIITLTIIAVFLPVYAGNSDIYISDTEAFLTALRKGTPVIYVDDLYFESETSVSLNYDVKIVGKNTKSQVKNVNFTVIGSNVPGETVEVTLENIVLDGGINKSDYIFPAEGKAFDRIFGDDRTEKRAIYGTWGYFTLTLNGCVIENYASYDGPAMYIDNNATFREGKRIINMKNTVIRNNISNYGSVVFGNDNGIYNIDNCLFTGNTAKEGSSVVISNGTATVKNSDFTGNCYYRFIVENDEGGDRYPDDKMTVKGIKYNYLHMAGTLYIGGANALVENCRIQDNTGKYGGGVGVTSPQAVVGAEKIEFVNCIISGNKAECGGAIYARSNQGHIISFIDCLITDNVADKGGIIYTTTTVPYGGNSGGSINFVFSTIAENIDHDAGSFAFYDLKKPDLSGSIELFGSIVIDNAKYEGEGHNYVIAKETAISDGTFTKEALEGITKNGLIPVQGSAADISVSADVYSAWATVYQKSTEKRKIGAQVKTDCGYVEALEKPSERTGERHLLIYIIPASVLVLLTVILFVFFRKKPKKTNDVQKCEYTIVTHEERVKLIKERYAECALTNKEIEVAAHLLVSDKRKDIAEKMNVADDTVKSHISHLFKKVNVKSKEEFKEKTGIH